MAERKETKKVSEPTRQLACYVDADAHTTCSHIHTKRAIWNVKGFDEVLHCCSPRPWRIDAENISSHLKQSLGSFTVDHVTSPLINWPIKTHLRPSTGKHHIHANTFKIKLHCADKGANTQTCEHTSWSTWRVSVKSLCPSKWLTFKENPFVSNVKRNSNPPYPHRLRITETDDSVQIMNQSQNDVFSAPMHLAVI